MAHSLLSACPTGRGTARRRHSLTIGLLMKCVHLALALLLGHALIQPESDAQLKTELAELDKLIAANPKRADAFQERGCVHFKLGNFKPSVQDFDRYIELLPEP